MLTGLKILLAEDNPTNQMVAVQMLESLGADVTLAVDGAEALDILDQRAFDVALIDIEMPRVSGIDLIRRVRSSSASVRDMPMIALTAYVMREHRAAIDEAGADGIIAKPILSIDQFGADILEHCKNRPVTVEEPEAEKVTKLDQNGAVIDMDIFERLASAFDGAGRIELSEKVCADVLSARNSVDNATGGDDFKELCGATHILISVAGAIGATRLQSLAQCLNSAGHAADTLEIGTKGPELVAEADRVLDFVRGSLEE